MLDRGLENSEPVVVGFDDKPLRRCHHASSILLGSRSQQRALHQAIAVDLVEQMCCVMTRSLKNDYIKAVIFTEPQLAVFEIGYCWNDLGECLQTDYPAIICLAVFDHLLHRK
ncbi:hypothetical protein N7527_004384 [Penicillium freii]|nr:hypothetical protein N7527_004384 [Penicillium freii]